MSLRTDRVSGIITWVFGGVMIVLASFGLLVTALQRVVIGAMQDMPNPVRHGICALKLSPLWHAAC